MLHYVRKYEYSNTLRVDIGGVINIDLLFWFRIFLYENESDEKKKLEINVWCHIEATCHL